MMIIAVNILGAEEGFLPKALMLAKPDDAITAHGPKMQKKKIKMMDTSRFIPLKVLPNPDSPNP